MIIQMMIAQHLSVPLLKSGRSWQREAGGNAPAYRDRVLTALGR